MKPTPEALLAHGDFLRGLARSLLGDEHLAEDAVQQTFVRALRAEPQSGGLRSWLTIVLRRLIQNDRRAELRRVAREGSVAQEPIVPSTEELVEREALRQEVVQAVFRLAEPYRATVILRYFESLSPTEIGDRLGISASTVRTRLARAHELLRASLDTSHTGGREAWAVLLMPMARPLSKIAGVGSLSSLSFLVMKKSVAAVVAMTLIVVVTWFALVDGASDPISSAGPNTAVSRLGVAVPDTGPVAVDAGTRRSLEGAATSPADDEVDARFAAALAGFHGRVVDLNGAPVARCGVELYRVAFDSVLGGGLESVEQSTKPQLRAAAEVTNEQGEFTLTGIRPRGMLMLRAGLGTKQPSAVVVQCSPKPGQVVELGDVVLHACASIIGKVVDEDGQAIANAKVIGIDLPASIQAMVPLHRFDPKGALLFAKGRAPVPVVALPPWVEGFLESLPIPRTVTDGDGAFALHGVPPHVMTLAIVVPGKQALLRQGLRPKAGAEMDVGELRVLEGEELWGEVVDSSGEPIVGAQVLAAPTGTFQPFDIAGAPLLTAQDGSFSMTGFPRGRVRVAARRGPGHRWEVSLPQSVDSAKVVLPALHSLTLVLSSDQNRAIEAPVLQLFVGDSAGVADMASFGLTQMIDVAARVTYAKGRMRVTDLEPGRYTARIRDLGHATASLSFMIEADCEQHVSLAARRLLTVRVCDPQGLPISGAAIFVRSGGGGAWSAQVPIRCGKTDSAGLLKTDEVAGGAVHVTASHPEFGRVAESVSSDIEELVLTFATDGVVEGVILKSGKPSLSGLWTVLLFPPGDSALALPSMAKVDDQGRFRFGNLQPGRYVVRATDSLDIAISPGAIFGLFKDSFMKKDFQGKVDVVAGGVAEVRLEVGPAKEVEAGPGARLSGAVLVDGKRRSGVLVACRAVLTSKVVMMKTNRDGGFSFDHVPVGKHTVTALDLTPRNSADNQPHLLSWQVIGIASGVDQHLSIDVVTATLAGRVHSDKGKAVGGLYVELKGVIGEPAKVSRSNRTRMVVKTAADGSFEADEVTPGKWTARVLVRNAKTVSPPSEEVLLTAGQRVTDVRVELGN